MIYTLSSDGTGIHIPIGRFSKSVHVDQRYSYSVSRASEKHLERILYILAHSAVQRKSRIIYPRARRKTICETRAQQLGFYTYIIRIM